MSVSTSALDVQQTRRARTEQAALEKIAERLAVQFPELSAEQIADAIRGRYESFEGSPIRDFVPVLVERSVRTDLASVSRRS
jgi:hypothetical protein